MILEKILLTIAALDFIIAIPILAIKIIREWGSTDV